MALLFACGEGDTGSSGPPAQVKSALSQKLGGLGAANPVATNYSPVSRTVQPVAIFATSGAVTDPQKVLSSAPTRLSGKNAYIVLDFGKEVGGIATLHFAAASTRDQSVGLAFSESSLYVGLNSDASNGGSGADGALIGAAVGGSSYTMPTDKLRGGFRYLTVFMHTDGWVDLDKVSLEITFAPDKADLSDYANYFSSNDALLNQIWYAGAYTVQSNTIAPTQGRVWGPPGSGWNNSAMIGVGISILADGAKRDRTVWPGDMGISVPTAFVSTNDLVSTKNSLSTMFNAQQTSGELPFAGPAVNFFGSDTYHMWSLLGTSTYYTYSGDLAYIKSIWPKYKLAMSFITNKIDANGLLNVTGRADWARSAQDGENIAANSILYAVLLGGANMAGAVGDPALAQTYNVKAAILKTAANTSMWVASQGLYKDNPSSNLYPQDGNSLAVWYGLTDSAAKSITLTQKLATRWNAFGATTPEWGNNIGTFPGSMEVNAHFAANDDQNGLTLIRRQWGYMLNSAIGTKSTFWEGFNADGSFAYGGPYMSLSHGWATGPTSALTFYVLGLAPETQLTQYRFIPHPGDLTNVEGRLTLPQGAVEASWSHPDANTFSSHLESPAGTTAKVGVPTRGMSDVTVTANGTTVYAHGASTGSVTGLSYAGSDLNYVYFTVQAGTWDFKELGAALPTAWNSCGAEGAVCSFSGIRTVRYGANGAYFYQNATASVTCTTPSFGGDPAYGVVKSCDYGATTDTWASCADENGTCSVSGPSVVRYGAETSYRYRAVTDNIACNSNAFGGDPIFGVLKRCDASPQPPEHGWTLCAGENNTCSFSGVKAVAFGARRVPLPDRHHQYCMQHHGFGDPILNTVKSCYYK